jgi:hypothetical protein
MEGEMKARGISATFLPMFEQEKAGLVNEFLIDKSPFGEDWQDV